MKKLIIITTMILISLAFIHAEVFIKQETKTGAFMGQPAKNLTQETWLGDNRMATLSDDMTMIMNLTEKKIFMIMHRTKSYIESTLPLDFTKLVPEQMGQMMKSMMEGMTVTVQANGQSKKVGNWNSNGYDVNMKMMGMEMKMTIWASSDVPFDWAKYVDLYAEVYKAQFRLGEKFIEEYKKIKGFPVLTEMTMMGMNVTTTVSEISEKKPGPEVYSVPAGYTKKERLSMQEMQKK